MLLRYIEVVILEIILEKPNSPKEHTTQCLNIAVAGKYSVKRIIIFKTSMEPKHHYYNLMVVFALLLQWGKVQFPDTFQQLLITLNIIKKIQFLESFFFPQQFNNLHKYIQFMFHFPLPF